MVSDQVSVFPIGALVHLSENKAHPKVNKTQNPLKIKEMT